MHNVRHFMVFIKEISFIFDIYLPNPEVFWKVFKDNQNWIAFAESIFFTKNKKISIKSHHIQSFAQKKIIRICYIDTIEQTYAILLSHSTKHYSFILEESYLDSEIFA